MEKTIEEKIKSEIRYYSVQSALLLEENQNLKDTVEHNISLYNRIATDLDESNMIIELLRKMMNNGK
ncbi:MAG: hypothetical protein M1533_02835 [Candidatus Thermoplasmatota archaeon]|nr:hypothetical protein [Candidatus Thermoplasmatota archaeon]MCL5793216.1 hypothetical protein [Candidatus Thermoplasmatota archaeon]